MQGPAAALRWASGSPPTLLRSLAPQSSPPARGCSGVRQDRLDRGDALLADAGVFRPRTRRSPSSRCPPRPRGCSVAGRDLGCGAVVLPADAGVFRWASTSSAWSGSPPCRRGSAPFGVDLTTGDTTSSPPMWGCSVGFALAPPQRDVLPADVGVFRSTRTTYGPASRPPRRRGGAPLMMSVSEVTAPSSPPTRGCSVPHQSPPEGRRVLPADAGLLR